MERFNLEVDDLVVVDSETRSARNAAKKRKWREIEALKEKYRLQKELESIDLAYEGASELNF
ncbi:DUF3545 family protein [Pseudaeromonas pectinilytica]|jgi:hypothetical protein